LPFPRQAAVIAEPYERAVLAGGTLVDFAFSHAARSSAVESDVRCSSDRRLCHCPQVTGVLAVGGGVRVAVAAGSTNTE
jgi:hypothetical protein